VLDSFLQAQASRFVSCIRLFDAAVLHAYVPLRAHTHYCARWFAYSHSPTSPRLRTGEGVARRLPPIWPRPCKGCDAPPIARPVRTVSSTPVSAPEDQASKSVAGPARPSRDPLFHAARFGRHSPCPAGAVTRPDSILLPQ
jgi:hypothetical protein